MSRVRWSRAIVSRARCVTCPLCHVHVHLAFSPALAATCRSLCPISPHPVLRLPPPLSLSRYISLHFKRLIVQLHCLDAGPTQTRRPTPVPSNLLHAMRAVTRNRVLNNVYLTTFVVAFGSVALSTLVPCPAHRLEAEAPGKERAKLTLEDAAVAQRPDREETKA